MIILSWLVGKSIHFLTKTCTRKNNFYVLVSSDLELWSLDLKFAPLVTLVQRYVSTKLEVCTAFLFRANRRHGQADGWTDGRGAILNEAPSEEPHNNLQ